MTDRPLDLTGRECVCGHRWGLFAEPNEDCERCRLIRLISALTNSVLGYRRRRVDDETAARAMAEEFGMRVEDIRNFCALEEPES